MSLYLMGLQELLILKHVADSGGDRHLLPGLECLLSVGYSRVELSLSALGHLADQLLGGLSIIL